MQPQTHKTHTSGPCHDIRDIGWRQENMSSANWIARERKRRIDLADKIRTQVSQAKLDQNNQLHQKPKCEAPPEEESWPTAECLLRPATPLDISGIVEVVNAEMAQEYPQILRTVPVRSKGIVDIYQDCQRSLRPFIVAVASENDFLDRSKWPKGADKVYAEYVQFKNSQESSGTGTILGFAFVSDARMGLFGEPCHGSRFAGRITVLVHPDNRGKLYGSALLDRILLSVAVYHRSVVDYKWECPSPALVYEHPVTKNQRKYARLHIEGLFARKDGDKEAWVDKMLEKFEFKKIGRFGEAVRTETGAWLDSVMWELESRPVTEITGDETQRRIGMD